jgi:hypothetical protein
MRCWSENNWNYGNYLFNNEDIKNKLKEIKNDVVLSFIDGVIPNDVLVAQFKHASIKKKKLASVKKR